MLNTTQIHVIDDDQTVCDSICTLLAGHGYQIHGYSNATDFWERLAPAEWGVVIYELSTADTPAEAMLQRLREQAGTFSTIVIASVAEVKLAVRLMQQGAIALLEKPFTEVELLAAVEAGLVRSRLLQEERLEHQSIAKRYLALNEDQRDVLERMIQGKAIKSCAFELQCSTRTIERRRKAVLDAMGVSSIPELAVLMTKYRNARASLNCPAE